MAELEMSFRDALLPKDMASRMLSYYSKFLSEGSDYTAEQAMLLRLPPPLKLELILFLSKDIILNIGLFRGQEPAFVVSICKTLLPVFAAPGDYLFREGAVANEMFFLQSGTVEMVREAGEMRSEEVLERLEAVCHFGEVALLLEGERREASVRATSFCCLFSYSRTQLLQMLEVFPRAKHNLTEMANKRLLQVKPKQRLRRIFRMAITVSKLCGNSQRRSAEGGSGTSPSAARVGSPSGARSQSPQTRSPELSVEVDADEDEDVMEVAAELSSGWRRGGGLANVSNFSGASFNNGRRSSACAADVCTLDFLETTATPERLREEIRNDSSFLTC